jgi:hypothetical protein
VYLQRLGRRKILFHRPQKTIKEMTYELAKQLKDAGFPQVKSVDTVPDRYGPDGTMHMWEHDAREFVDYQYGYKIPNLSELIVACGDNFASLQKKVGGYSAFGFGDEDSMQYGYSATPEEAVAKLWLALNQK